MKQIEVIRLHNRHLAALAQVYEQSFPAEERMPWNLLSTDVLAGNRDGFGAIVGGEAMGLAKAKRLSQDDVILECLGVAKSERSRGIGGQLLDHLVARYREVGVRYLVFEVDPPLTRTNGARGGSSFIGVLAPWAGRVRAPLRHAKPRRPGGHSDAPYGIRIGCGRDVIRPRIAAKSL